MLDILTRSSTNTTGTVPLWPWFAAPWARLPLQGDMGTWAPVLQLKFPGVTFIALLIAAFSKVKIYMFILTGVSWPNPDWKKRKKEMNANRLIVCK